MGSTFLEHTVTACDRDNSISIIQIKGSLDSNTVPDFEEAIMALIENEKKHKIIMDCKELEFVSSAGMGLFMGVLEELEDNTEDGFIKFINVIPEVYEVFEMLEFTDDFEIFNSLDEALSS